MKIAHVLRKYNPEEWGGTEMALSTLFYGLRKKDVHTVIFCPKTEEQKTDPFGDMGCQIRRFHALAPFWGISATQRKQLISVGGNLWSFDLPWLLWKEPNIAIIHTHALNRLGAIAWAIARIRGLPFVLSIHGGFLDLPHETREKLEEPRKGAWEWGKVFGWLLRSRRLLEHADAILTSNRREAELLRLKFPQKKIVLQSHAVDVKRYQTDCRDFAADAFPIIKKRKILLVAARIDPIKNQSWVVEQMPYLLRRHPDTVLFLVGACTDETYGAELIKRVSFLGLEEKVVFLGGFPPDDLRFIGLYQSASAVIVPSISETFGLTILDAYAAGAPVISSTTSGAQEIITHQVNGWLFDLSKPEEFHRAIDQVLNPNDLVKNLICNGKETVLKKYSVDVIAEQMYLFYMGLYQRKN